MKTLIYYFTGTGNSLAAARTIARELGETGLAPIAQEKRPGRIVPPADRVGIVCPVYDAGLPLIVREFAERLDLGVVKYTFAVVTMGGIGISALRQLNGILVQGGNRKLDAAFAVRMPGNFPPVSRPPSAEKRAEILAKADTRLAAIAATIASGARVSPGFSPLSAIMKSLTYGPFSRSVHDTDRNFSVGGSCTSCGTCERVCPVGNIAMTDGRPAWQHRCELCCACLHFCPVEAIQLSVLQGTLGRGRYRHPDLSAEDMMIQQGGP